MIEALMDHRQGVIRRELRAHMERRVIRRWPMRKAGGEAWQTWCAKYEDRYDDKWHEPYFTCRVRKNRKYNSSWLLKEYSEDRR